MKFCLVFLFWILFVACNSNNTDIAQPTTSDTARTITTEDLRKARPQFAGYRPINLNILDTMRYLRIIVNGNKLIKTWMVYFDRNMNKWQTLRWEGKGSNNKLLVDTIFNPIVGITHFYEDIPSFYMAWSDDEGKTWKPLDMSLAILSGCKHPNLKGHSKYAQLIISNDFFNDTHLPSICIAWQWNYLASPLHGEGITSRLDLSKFCDAIQELPRKK